MEKGQKTRCQQCARNDKHRNNSRKKKVPPIVVSVDCEGAEKHGVMYLVSASYGREDGTSKSLTAPEGEHLTGPVVLHWLVDELAGDYTDEDGKTWTQVVTAFHFGWDTSVITRDFAGPDLMLVHKATAKKRGLLCWTAHPTEEEKAECHKFHRDDTELIQEIIGEGGEGDLLAYDPGSHLAITSSVKRRFYVEHRPHGDRFEGNRRLDIHDTGTAFVGGLLRVLAVWQPELTDAQHAAIEWGKQARKQGFLGGTLAEIEAYSEAECVAHARVVRLLLTTIRDAAQISMDPKALFGSGSIAGAAFKYHGVLKRDDTHEGRETFGGVTVDDLARLTYYGGLIETPVLGRLTDLVDELDINSAYPSKAIMLPCMRAGHGHWGHHRGRWDGRAPRDVPGHVLASWMVTTPSSPPFTVRTKKGLVRAPLTGDRVWVTLPEFWAARDQFSDDVVSHEVVWWVQECECPNPLAWLDDIYTARQKVKKEMKGETEGSDEWQALNCRQEALKLIINSCYGKLAQQKHGGGSYTNLHWAAYITGATRAQVRAETWLREAQGGIAVYQHTDSVLSIGGAPQDGGKALGAWGMEHQSADLVIVQPGLAVALGGGKSASRGCGINEFRTATEEWAATHDLTKHPLTWEPITIPRNQMISRKTAIARGKPYLAGSFADAPLTVQFGSTKRDIANATPVPGNPMAWAIPPIDYVEHVATVEDLKDWETKLDKMAKEAGFDDDPLPGS